MFWQPTHLPILFPPSGGEFKMRPLAHWIFAFISGLPRSELFRYFVSGPIGCSLLGQALFPIWEVNKNETSGYLAKVLDLYISDVLADFSSKIIHFPIWKVNLNKTPGILNICLYFRSSKERASSIHSLRADRLLSARNSMAAFRPYPTSTGIPLVWGREVRSSNRWTWKKVLEFGKDKYRK